METIHNFINEHPVWTILILVFIAGIIVLIHAIRNAEEID